MASVFRFEDSDAFNVEIMDYHWWQTCDEHPKQASA